MKKLLLIVPLFLSACASQDLSWIDQEGKAEAVLPASERALVLPAGERTAANDLSVPQPPAVSLIESDINLEPGEVIDGNGVPVLNLDMASLEAIALLQTELQGYAVSVVELNDSGSAMVIQSADYLLEGNPSWFNRFSQRLRLTFSDIGGQSRVSVWTLDNAQPDEAVRQQVFTMLREILI